MKNVKANIKKFLKDESGQGTVEYVLILVAVVAIAVVFGPEIKNQIMTKLGTLGSDIQGFTP